MGGFGWVINRTAWMKYCKNINWDWDVQATTNINNSKEFKNYCTVKSYLDHIGFTGTHKSGENGHPMSIDRAINFFD